MSENRHDRQDAAAEARRRFLAQCGKFALATPPAIVLLLADAQQSVSAAVSGVKRKPKSPV